MKLETHVRLAVMLIGISAMGITVAGGHFIKQGIILTPHGFGTIGLLTLCFILSFVYFFYYTNLWEEKHDA